jgi:hypothetical protein
VTDEQFRELQAIDALRQKLDVNGFFIVACLSGTKRPLGDRWQRRALEREYLRYGCVWHARNTGILLNGLRAVDLDVDDPALVSLLRRLALNTFGSSPPVRFRDNSPRQLLLYRATEGAPPTLSLKGRLGGVQILGRDHHALAFGRHPSGADLYWVRSPAEVAVGELEGGSEAQVHSFLCEAAKLVEAPEPTFGIIPTGRRVADTRADPAADLPDISRIREALRRIPVPADFDANNRIAMAVYAATGGSDAGLEALIEWRGEGGGFSAAKTAARWQHFHRSPPTSLTAGSLFHAADCADQQRLAGFLDLGLRR